MVLRQSHFRTHDNLLRECNENYFIKKKPKPAGSTVCFDLISNCTSLIIMSFVYEYNFIYFLK